MLRKYLGRFTEGSLVLTLQQQGDEDHTWTANSFTPMLQQTLAVNITRGAGETLRVIDLHDHKQEDLSTNEPTLSCAKIHRVKIFIYLVSLCSVLVQDILCLDHFRA